MAQGSGQVRSGGQTKFDRDIQKVAASIQTARQQAKVEARRQIESEKKRKHVFGSK